MVKVTVVIPLYNKEQFIEHAIRSVIDQTYQDWELLIIDDKSTDDSLQRVQPFLKDHRINCIALKKNSGQNHVYNYALTRIDTEYLVQLDADDWLDKNALKFLVETADKYQNAGLIYGNHMKYVVDDQDNILEEEPIILEAYKDRYDLLYKMNYAMVPRCYRTKMLREVGGWMAQSKGDIIAEDVQIALRLARKFDCVWIDEILYYRRKYKSNIEKFEKTRPLAREYRYTLYNQMLREWGNEYVPKWNVINGSYYLEGLGPNDTNHAEKDPGYTIVIPNYNHGDTLVQAVRSALHQTLEPETILVIDDASTDHSISRLKSTIKSSRIRIIEMDKNVGISTVLNTALSLIDTPYFIQLDGDDWLEEHAAERLVRNLENKPNAAFAYGNHRLWKKGEDGKLLHANTVIQPPFKDHYDILLQLGYMVNPRSYRTEAVRKVGGWLTNDPWNGRYFEDARMIIRLAAQHEWVHVEEVLHNVRFNRKKSDGKIKYYNHLRKTFYEEMLEKWGGQYKPIWKKAPTGRTILEKLEPTIE